MADCICIEGIETNNLKGIDVKFEKKALNLILGPSGSGKSSLAYDTVAQIGQHEYMAMFADDVAEPSYKVKNYENMVAAVPIKQTNGNNNLHSTIGTYFGLNRSIAFLYAALTGVSEEHFILNRPENLCEKCHGLGFTNVLDIKRIVDYNIPIEKNPFKCWNKYKDFYCQILKTFCEEVGIDSTKSFRQLSSAEQDTLLSGESRVKYKFKYKRVNYADAQRTTYYYGILTGKPMMLDYKTSDKFYSDKTCDCCNGQKYGNASNQYRVYGLSIGEFMTMPFSELLPLVETIKKDIKDSKLLSALSVIQLFLSKAIDLRLGHLFFHRAIPTLSGGELQRLRMVQVFNSQLTDMLIVLDEPLAGLSGDERNAVFNHVIALTKRHTVLVVDHSDIFVEFAKKIYALGPGGGVKGGELIDVTTYLKAENVNRKFDVHTSLDAIQVKISNNIYQYRGVNITLLKDCMNIVTGPSGVGKSTLLREFFPQQFEKYTYINQRPLIGNKYSSVMTALDLAGKIQDIFAKKHSKDRRFFSNQSGCDGACPVCGGAGYIEYGYDDRTRSILSCGECEGTGFNIILKKYEVKKKSMLDIWNMTVDDGIDYFKDLDPRIADTLEEASAILLGHLKLGQATSTLSGGENVRLKIMKAARTNSNVLGIDEPFKGLSPSEIYLVASFFEKIRAKKKTIVVVDHSENAEQYFAKKIIVSNQSGIIQETPIS
ncbi:MAG: ATP-binding cassette domain-containing protein [Prevotellaceae bacterium]|nr:ATP-binding cassette domain-containing protein [Prevotellaceae bacterium]